MIPEIATILDMLVAGEISKDQATAWINERETRDKIWRNRVEKYPSTTIVFKAARKETP